MSEAEVIIEYLQSDLYEEAAGPPITSSEDLLDRGPIDSLGIVRLVDFLEERFGVQIGPGEVTIKNFRSVDTMLALIARKLESEGA